MDDPDDPLVSEDQVPAYDLVERKIKDIDTSIIIYRVYYFFNSMIYRFQLLKKDKLCIMEVPRSLLDNLSRNGTSSESQLNELLNESIENAECWNEFNE